ncbi:PEP-CTERM protein-sorting domain-containing protein [Rubritalea squalenifaciens DSM 18772]|uniref:PEP-CTERM protein-sorting domain-containing protein n=1 Tax=Rubritalea squalenifaciens DSM 18772 TaxID=1123071 RepID=A0A1M6PH00_9BACT|nr:PEP-CTERM sorting domain-containing protein [Rubritalea squalenifaciens]SHK07194.1 PEP-CTERM protein-sorting domain-containing protein [Rubritalea squalenifaciens DSM 18772]
MKSLYISAISALLLTPIGSAAVSYTMSLGTFYESDGTTSLQDNAVGLLFVNTDNSSTSSFGSALIGFDLSQTPQADSAVATPITVGGFELIAAFNGDSNGQFVGRAVDDILKDSGISNNDPLVFVFFESITSLSGTVGANENFGVLTGMTADQNLAPGGPAFEIPDTDGTFEILFGDSTVGGTTPQADFVADQVTAIPEPSSFALIGLGALATLFRRRR